MFDEIEKKSFLAFDVQAFLKKVRAEQLHNGGGRNGNAEVWQRYEFLIAAIEAEHLVSVVTKEQYDALAKEVDFERGACGLA